MSLAKKQRVRKEARNIQAQNSLPLNEIVFTQDLNEKWLNSNELSVWPVYDTCGYSGDFIECKDKNQAYNELLYSLNNNLYERYHDL